MFWAGMAFLLGDLVFQQSSQLHNPHWLLVLPAVIVLLYRKSGWYLLVGWFLCGYAWGLGYAHLMKMQEIPQSCLYVPLSVEGDVYDIPQSNTNRVRFLLDVSTIHSPECTPINLPRRLSLSWYQTDKAPQAGERWVLKVKLRKTRNFYNEGGFDYEAYLLGQGIRYSGSVIDGEQLEAPEQPLISSRARLSERIGELLPESPASGIVRALVVGDRSGITAEQKVALLHSGTLHLMAISGLHIGMVGTLGYFLFSVAWRLYPRLSLLIPAPVFAVSGALIVATLYAFLAGFSLPTQRALIMLFIVMTGVMMRRRTDAGTILGLAIFVVLLLDPFSVNLPGFWLSFVAVGLLLFGLQKAGNRSLIYRWTAIQAVLLIGLFPLSLMFFHGASIVAPLANLIAINWVGILVLPPALSGVLLDQMGFALGYQLLNLAASGVEWLLILLQMFASLPVSWIELPSQAISIILVAGFGVLLLLGPRGWPARSLGLILAGAMVFTHRPPPAAGEFWLDMLDVGEGLAIVVRTSEHVLIFDAGPAFSPDFDTGQAVILPWLRHEGIDHIDNLVVSHGDNDHIGGVGSLLSGMSVTRIITSVPERLDRNAEGCVGGDAWQWDGVFFYILHPPQSGWPFEGNNSSCVLLVENQEHSLLITGDIESMAEFRLARAYPGLSAEVLVVPHHGSRTSSTEAFLNKLKPEYALVSTGYRNRFGFPRPEVVERYGKSGVSLFNTAEEGGIRVRFPKNGPVPPPDGYIDGHLRYWHSARVSGP